ncbi:MAG: class IV adenylate cyclase [Pirellulales bacterium]
MMQFEVEQKFLVADTAKLIEHVTQAGGQFAAPIEQVDCYYAHPVRDFGRTDEAVRVRSVGEQNCVTYKGPKIDAATKTRREIEVGIASGRDAAQQFGEFLEAVGFRPVAEVRKQRSCARIDCDGVEIELALDEVVGVGTYVELEAMADESQLDERRGAIKALADRLSLTQSERRSYLELLLER